MKFYDSNGREVEIEETDGGYEEAFILSAHYLDADDEEVPDHELDYLQDCYAEWVMDNEYQKMVMKAEDAFDGDR